MKVHWQIIWEFLHLLLGIQGLVHYLAKNEYLYSDLVNIKELAELIQWGCVLESMEMAKEFEPYPAFYGSRWETGEQFDSYICMPYNL